MFRRQSWQQLAGILLFSTTLCLSSSVAGVSAIQGEGKLAGDARAEVDPDLKEAFDRLLETSEQPDSMAYLSSRYPLFAAVLAADVQRVKSLLAAGADVNRDINGFTPLHYAALKGNVTLASLLLENGAQVDRTDDTRQVQPIHMAAVSGSTNMMALLLESGADIHAQADDRMMPIHLAVASGHYDATAYLLDQGARLFAKAYKGRTLLHWAVAGNSVRTMRLLIERGLSPNAKDSDGESPLHEAAHLGRERMVRYLLTLDVAVDQRDDKGHSPLFWAAWRGDNAITKELLRAGADVNLRDDQGWTALFITAFEGHLDTLKVLHASGAEITLRNDEGITPAHIAAEFGYPDILDWLIKNGISPDVVDKDGETLLHYAAKGGQPNCAAAVLDLGADLGSREKNGNTPLHTAARCGHNETVRLLVERGAEVEARDAYGLTPLQDAVIGKYESTALLLLELGADPRTIDDEEVSALHWAAKAGLVDVVEALIDAGADIEGRDNDGYTPLHFAAMGNRPEVVRLLIDAGADVNATDNDGDTALETSTRRPRMEAMKVLLEAGADPNIVGTSWAPLHHVARTNLLEGARLLLEHGANIDVFDESDPGWTPLFCAIKWNHPEMVAFLLEYDPDLTVRESNGSTPLHLAIVDGHTEIERMLRAKGATTSPDDPPTVPVHLYYDNPEARNVSVLGEFNWWTVGMFAMKKDEDGRWYRHFRLPPGDHTYKLWVDGKRILDPGNAQTKVVGGIVNSLIHVPEDAETIVLNGERQDAVLVHFEVDAPNARSVTVAGEFNGWHAHAMPLERQSDGTWILEHALSRGTYGYKYVVDGKWMLDPKNPDTTMVEGVENSLLDLTDCEGTFSPAREETADEVTVHFALYDPRASDVCVAGEFNGWNTAELQLDKDAEGVWRGSTTVPAGTYGYKYVVDGRWKMDLANPRTKMVEGIENSALIAAGESVRLQPETRDD
jgi:ankyrin repeat protein